MPEKQRLTEIYPTEILQSGSSTNSYIIVMYEPATKTSIPILIGEHEAQAIILAKENIEMRRPLTHRLLCNICNEFSLEIERVVIDKFSEGIFYTTIYMSDSIGSPHHIDSRASDAIAIALTVNAPIFMTTDVLAETGIQNTDMETFMDMDDEQDYQPAVEELEEQLQQLLEDEEYEKAAEIQRQIEKLKGNGN
ncbi:MAG: bifunctional nuclease family protein [Bacteroidales bacterium]|nr:bifunctional nuclease family protein [Bacteroidales bacterium]